MNSSVCQTPLTWDTLLAYWLGELEADNEARIEEHYLGCEHCSQRLEELVTLAREARALLRMSGVNLILNDRFVHRLKAHGLRVREYRVPRNGAVNCTVTPEDDFVVAYLDAPLEGVTRLDMIQFDEAGNEIRHEDIPFNADDGDVVFATRIDTLRALPASTLRVRLLAVDAQHERSLGEYTFKHTPSASTTS